MIEPTEERLKDIMTDHEAAKAVLIQNHVLLSELNEIYGKISKLRMEIKELNLRYAELKADGWR